MSDFPTTLSNLLMWVDGRAPAYSDTAGSVVASPFAGRVRRANYATPATGNAQAPDVARSPFRETSALNFELGQSSYMAAPVAATCTQDAVTIAFTLSPRNNPSGSPQAIICNGTALRIWLFTDNIVDVNYNGSGGNWVVGPTGGAEPYARVPLGSRAAGVIRMSSTQIRASVVVDGVQTDYSTTASVSNTTLSAANWFIGWDGATDPTTSDTLFHGAIGQALVIGHVSSDAEVAGLLAYFSANPAPHYCPSEVPILTVNGDSIAASSAGVFGVPMTKRWTSGMQALLNATQPVNVINAAISGDSIVHQRDVTFPTLLQPFYDPARAKHGHILAAGTNDIATGHRTGPVVLADQYTAADTVLALGMQPFVCTILPRNPGGGFDVATFETARTYYNTHVLAEAVGRGYRVIDWNTIPQAADPTNTTYYSDGIHPLPALHTLMAQVAAASVQPWLTPPAAMASAWSPAFIPSR